MASEMRMNPATTLTWIRASMQATIEAERPLSSEEEWVARARRGDRDAFGQLVRRFERRVFRLAGRFFRRPEDVQDVAQDTFLTAWRKLDRYSGRAPFEHWLTRVCLNTCYSRLRKNMPETEGLDREIAAHDSDPDARLDVERLLARLSPADRFVLVLLDGEGWSVKEIAQRLGWSVSNVKVRAHRARKRLRRVMNEEIDHAV
jgi:RNA polymerase sigma-70 factor (ECF subfamily)